MQIRFTVFVELLAQFAPKQLVSQPNAISIDDIALAIFGDLLDPPVAVIFFNFAAIHSLRFTCKSQYAAELVQARFRVWWNCNQILVASLPSPFSAGLRVRISMFAFGGKARGTTLLACAFEITGR